MRDCVTGAVCLLMGASGWVLCA